jgi:hypothetical protein
LRLNSGQLDLVAHIFGRTVSGVDNELAVA